MIGLAAVAVLAIVIVVTAAVVDTSGSGESQPACSTPPAVLPDDVQIPLTPPPFDPNNVVQCLTEVEIPAGFDLPGISESDPPVEIEIDNRTFTPPPRRVNVNGAVFEVPPDMEMSGLGIVEGRDCLVRVLSIGESSVGFCENTGELLKSRVQDEHKHRFDELLEALADSGESRP